MSVKLPLIVKKQPTNSFHSKPVPEDTTQKEQNSILPEQLSQSAYEHFQQVQQLQPEAQPTPLQTITVLKNQSHAAKVHEQRAQPKEEKHILKESKAKSNLQQLLKLSEEKEKIIESLREVVSSKKKEIKHIGDQIDKDLNRSIIKATKQQNINIRDIFSAKMANTENQKLNNLNEELKKVRLNVKKIKSEIQKLQDALSDPVSMINNERGIDCQRKIKEAQSDIREIEHEKTLLSEEITRGGEDANQEEEKQRNQKMSHLGAQLAEIQNAQKQQKLDMYRLEKEDILLMEKIKYLQERDGLVGVKKPKNNQKDREKLEQQIKELILQINDGIQERNKVEKQKKQKSKNLSNEKSTFQSKNWELCNKIREIDAFLLQYYQRRTKRKELKQIQTIDVMQKSISGKIQPQSAVSQSLYKSKISQNDKNVASEIILVEKRKIYEFGSREQVQNEINLSDEFLGGRLIVKSIQITADQQKVYSISATYSNMLNAKIQGFVMGSKTVAEQAQVLTLDLLKDQVINFIHVGYCEKLYVTFLHFITSEGKELKWGKMENLAKSEQKHIKKYETSFLKAKLILQTDSLNRNITLLSNLTFVTTFMSPK